MTSLTWAHACRPCSGCQATGAAVVDRISLRGSGRKRKTYRLLAAQRLSGMASDSPVSGGPRLPTSQIRRTTLDWEGLPAPEAERTKPHENRGAGSRTCATNFCHGKHQCALLRAWLPFSLPATLRLLWPFSVDSCRDTPLPREVVDFTSFSFEQVDSCIASGVHRGRGESSRG